MKKLIMAFFVTGSFLFFSTTVFAQAATDVACTGCVGATDLATSAVTGTKIQNGAVTATKLQNNAVTSSKISDGTIAAADVADSAITSAKISNGTITSDDILDSTITAAKINNAGLSADQLDGIDSSEFVRTSGGTIGGLTVSGDNITSSGDICIGACE